MIKKIILVTIVLYWNSQILVGQVWKDDLLLFFENEEQVQMIKAEDDFEDLMRKLKKKQENCKNEEAFLKFSFHKIHQKYLKTYSKYSTIEHTLGNQIYDCVTGVAIYKIFLKELGYKAEIHETLYHVYLTVTTSKGKEILFESTDAMYGFIKNPQKIQETRMEYQYDGWVMGSDSLAFEDKIITLKELAGIQFYNQALMHYKNYDYEKAYRLSDWAMTLYPNERIESVKIMSDYYTLDFKLKKF